jgi:hypothetical protein
MRERAMPKDGWALLESGQYTEAIEKLEQEFAADKDPLTGANLGLACLLAGNPARAVAVLDGMLDDRSVTTAEYAMAGIARWLLGRKKEAVVVWKKGIGCQYTDAAGGMELPLLLYFAAVSEPGLLALPKARLTVSTATKHPWAECWPGPLGAYVLEDLSETEVRRAAVFSNRDITRCQTAQVEFYVGVKALESGDRHAFKGQMQVCADIPNWYLENEYHLARFEASALYKAGGDILD